MNFTNNVLNHSIINNTIDLMANGNVSGLETSSESTTTSLTSIVSSAIHFPNAFDGTRLFPGNGTHFIDLKNINVTDDELHDFAKKLLEYNQYNRSHVNESFACKYYCDGFFKDLFSSYKTMHGYISLAVSILIIHMKYFPLKENTFEYKKKQQIINKTIYHQFFFFVQKKHIGFRFVYSERLQIY